ncbi:hypothetical protein [Emticicia sp. C21]|uniref:hypothetical protein n=1 Tax=Emticicia sp. C21 TaxID=2302915 RepID=UPI000E347326|nr:hypothetical protein [Emticicia sp. C21]RFS17352.1 hypothetical protein D0T08_06115 [Emticicia sp. C21]
MDNRPTILVAFANNLERPLEYLKVEIEKIRKILSKHDYYFRIRVVENATISDIGEVIEECKDHIVLFMYSGHADGLSIETEEHRMSAKGLANELEKCGNLQLVILNGCNSQGHIRFIEAIKTPIVIATESAVGDLSASTFSQVLFENLFDEETIEKAFDEALKKAESYRGNGGKIESDKQIGRFLDESNTIDNIWILRVNEETSNHWTVYKEVKKFKNSGDYEPNEYLKDCLFEALCKPNLKVCNYNDYEGARAEIWKLFPQFISKLIFDLCAESTGNSTIDIGKRFDKPTITRLEKCIQFYQTIQEVLLSITLSLIRDSLVKNKQTSTEPLKLVFEEAVSKKINKIKPLKAGIEWLNAWLKALNIDNSKLFVKELIELKIDVLDEVAKFFEKLNDDITHNSNLKESQLNRWCESAEEMLVDLIGQNLFLVNYQFLSIKNITVYKNRTHPKARFGLELSVYEWKDSEIIDTDDRKGGAKIESTPDSFSVLMTKIRDVSQDVVIDLEDSLKSIESDQYLNLSPFLIDKNIKYEKEALTHISYIDTIANNKYTYESLWAKDMPFIISDTREMRVVFNDINDQFNHFNKLIS